MSFFILICLSLGISIVIIESPIIIGLWILTLRINISLICMFYRRRWFGYIIFIIYVGGILVMFSYFRAIQPNQYIRINKRISFFFLVIINLPARGYIVLVDIFKVTEINIFSLFIENNIWFFFLLALVLFLALVSVVKITISGRGPLRPFKNYV